MADEHDISGNLACLLKATGQSAPMSKPILEINTKHAVVQRLNGESEETRFADWNHILFDQALLAEGGQFNDPAAFVRRLNELWLAM